MSEIEQGAESDKYDLIAKTTGMQNLIQSMAKKAARMRPMPPWDDLQDPLWGKVDKLILDALSTLKKEKIKEPLKTLAIVFIRWSFNDLDKGVQTVALRLMEVFGLVECYRVLVEHARKEDYYLHDIVLPWWAILSPELIEIKKDHWRWRKLLNSIREILLQRNFLTEKNKNNGKK